MAAAVDEVEVDWIPLGEAFSHALAVAEADLGVTSPRGHSLGAGPSGAPWRPNAHQLKLLLRENIDVDVDDPEKDRAKRILWLWELAATRAHTDLMHLLREGRVAARAEWTGNWIGRMDQPDCRGEVLPVPPEFWNAGWTKRGRPAAPIPNYESGTAMEAAGDAKIGFWGSVVRVEVRRQDVLAGFGLPRRSEYLPSVDGGRFCFNGTEWLVACGGETATVPSSNGMGYLAVLLARPNETLSWAAVVETGSLVMNGKSPERAYRDAAPSMPQEDGHGMYDDELEHTWSMDADRNAINRRDAEAEAILLNNQLRDRRAQLEGAAPSRRARLEEEIKALEASRAHANDSARRSLTSDDKYRQLLYHGLDDAFRYLAVVCPSFVRHVGTFRKDERRALVLRDGGIAYCPPAGSGGLAPYWDTEPAAQPPGRN